MSAELIAILATGVPVILVGIGMIYKIGQTSTTVRNSATKIDTLSDDFGNFSRDMNTRVSHLEGAAGAD